MNKFDLDIIHERIYSQEFVNLFFEKIKPSINDFEINRICYILELIFDPVICFFIFYLIFFSRYKEYSFSFYMTIITMLILISSIYQWILNRYYKDTKDVFFVDLFSLICDNKYYQPDKKEILEDLIKIKSLKIINWKNCEFKEDYHKHRLSFDGNIMTIQRVEIYKPVPGYGGYYIYEQGTLISLPFKNTNGKEIIITASKNNYKTFCEDDDLKNRIFTEEFTKTLLMLGKKYKKIFLNISNNQINIYIKSKYFKFALPIFKSAKNISTYRQLLQNFFGFILLCQDN